MGNFIFDNISNGLYNLELEYWGNIKNQTVEISNSNLTLYIEFDSIAQYLDGVTVEAKKPLIEKKIDRLVFNVENSITSTGGSALDALSKTPYVQVKNEYIGLVGKSGVAIMVNERLLQMSGTDLINYLQSIKSEDISKIEVITNPSSKYDAEGNSGLINIVLKRGKKNDFFSGNLYSSYEQRTYSTLSGGAGINYKKNKLYISSGVGGNYGKSAPIEKLSATYPDRSLYQTSNRIDYRKNLSGRFLAEYDISKKSKIGFQYLGGYSLPDIEEKILSQYKNNSPINDSTLKTNAYKSTKSAYNSLNVNLSSQLDTIGKKLFFDINYFNIKTNNERPFSSNTFNHLNELINGSFVGNRNNGLQDVAIVASKLDFEIPNKIANLTFGAKVSFVKNNSNNAMFNLIDNQYIINPNQSDTFKYTENIQALYFTISKAIKKWEFQFGLRGENTQTKGISVTYDTTTTNNYFKLFPTVFVNYTPNNDNVFSVNYSKRIGRPSYRHLNPFRWYLNTHNYSEGNPLLQPALINNIEIGHLYKNKLNSTFYISYINPGYTQIAFVENSSNIFYFKPINFFTQTNIGISEYYQVEIGKYIISSIIAGAYYSDIRSEIAITEKRKSMFSGNIEIQNSFVLNQKRTLFAELNGWYQTPQVTEILNQKSYGSVDIGVRYLLLDKKLSIVLNVSDIFKTSYNRYYNTINGIGQTFNNYYDNRYIRLSLNYNFGNRDIKNKQQSQSNDDEKRRT